MYTCQTIAISEGFHSNTRHAVTNGHARKSCTRPKGIMSNTRYTVTDGHARQTTTKLEGIIADARYAVGNCNTCQTAALIKGTPTDARHAVRDCDACQIAAAREGIIADARYAVGNCNTCQTAALIKGTPTDARHAVRDCDACQIAAARESRTADLGHAVTKQGKRHKLFALFIIQVFKQTNRNHSVLYNAICKNRIIAYTLYTFGHNDVPERFTIGKCITAHKESAVLNGVICRVSVGIRQKRFADFTVKIEHFIAFDNMRIFCNRGCRRMFLS